MTRGRWAQCEDEGKKRMYLKEDGGRLFSGESRVRAVVTGI